MIDALAFLMGLSAPSSDVARHTEPVCGIYDARQIATEQKACLGRMVGDLLGEFSLEFRPDLTLGWQYLEESDTCHLVNDGGRLPSIWPVDNQGEALALPLDGFRGDVQYELGSDLRPTNVVVTYDLAQYDEFEHATVFQDFVSRSVARWMFSSGCRPGEKTHTSVLLVYDE